VRTSRGSDVLVPSWLGGYRREWLRTDLIAGATITALLVPEGMAYAQLAGVPPQAAFYAAPIALIAYALLGSSRQLVVAVSAAVASMSGVAIAGFAEPDSARWIVLTAAIAVLAGAISAIAGLLRLGRLAAFFSESVLTGFVFGLALTIAIKQVPKLFGLPAGGGDFWQRAADILSHISEVVPLTALLGITTLVVAIWIEQHLPRVPGALVVLLGGLGASALFQLSAHGVATVGEIPAGLVGPAFPDVSFGDVLALAPAAAGLALVAFAEAYGPARELATREGYQIDANRELIGLGASNVGAGLFQGFPIGASLSKTAAAQRAGGRTPVASLTAAGLTVLVALTVAPAFSALPEAVLGAIVVVAVAGMMRVDELRRIATISRRDLAVSIIALLGVLTFEPLVGLAIAVLLSLGLLVWRASEGRLSRLGLDPHGNELATIGRDPEAGEVPGTLIVRPDEGLFFANATAVREGILELVHTTRPHPTRVVLDLEMTSAPDVPALDALRELHDELVHEGITLDLSRLHGSVGALLDRSGVGQTIGAGHLHGRTIDAVRASVRTP
jgi:sulfate permease, SulP family